ncbi:LysR family transcriptional regulator [Pelagibius sp. 7325]|uniref:LysR family transcriptional regulator n=1 Tax=Pelagibius sp. 7325 TaxID=3131994 RepID=UPI0030ED2ED0
MNEFDSLKLFVTVIESGGFNRAAKRLGISKSIVSRRIAQIEADLGARLLSRTTRGISPTDAGMEFKERAERILADYEEAREAVAQRGGEVVGLLRLSVPLSFGVRHVAPILAALAARHPRLELDVSYSDRIVDIMGERFDAAIRIGRLEDSALIARQLAQTRAVVVASPDYLARHGTPAVPADLSGHDCLIYTGSRQSDWLFQSGKRTVSVRPKGRLRSDSGEAILQWATAGLGVAMVPTFLLSGEFEQGRLVPLLLDHPAPELGIFVVRPPGAYVPGKVRVLVDTLAEHFSGPPRWDPCMMKVAGADGAGR